jgi:hypothetical protein
LVTLAKSDRIWGADLFPDLGPEIRLAVSKRSKEARLPHLGPQIRVAASQRRKEAYILTGIVLAALGTFSLGVVIFVQFGALKIEVASLKRDLAGTAEKLAKLEANVIAVRPGPNAIKDGADARTLASAGRTPQTLFVLTQDEIQLIRDFIKVPPPLPGAAPSINVGDLLPDTVLAPLPEPIMQKVPKLLGARLMVDRNSAIVVVSPGTNRVDVIINRNETGTSAH